MKKAYVFILFVLIISCQKTSKKATVVSGIFPGFSNKTIELLSVKKYFPGIPRDTLFITTKTDSTGAYKFKIPSIESGFYQVLHENYQLMNYDLYIENGDSLYIEKSGWNDEPKFLISGSSTENLDLLNNDYKLYTQSQNFQQKIQNNMFNPNLNFKTFLDSLYNGRIKTLHRSSNSDKLIKYYTNTMLAEKATFLIEYLEKRNLMLKGNYSFYYPKDSLYFDFTTKLNFKGNNVHSTNYKTLANKFTLLKARLAMKNVEEDTFSREELLWKHNFIKALKKSPFRDVLMIMSIQNLSLKMYEDNFFNNLDTILNLEKDFFTFPYNSYVFDKNIKGYGQLKPKALAPNFTLPDTAGRLVSLSDLKGKLIYINFWGTWCMPCIKELPDLITVFEKYKEEVIFINIALEFGDEEIENWKKVISGEHNLFKEILNGKNFPGINLVAEKQFQNKQIEPYKINFAPTHVLIDSDGKIINSRAAGPRNIGLKFDEILKKKKKN